jgi:hypothetical protein
MVAGFKSFALDIEKENLKPEYQNQSQQKK